MENTFCTAEGTAFPDTNTESQLGYATGRASLR